MSWLLIITFSAVINGVQITGQFRDRTLYENYPACANAGIAYHVAWPQVFSRVDCREIGHIRS